MRLKRIILMVVLMATVNASYAANSTPQDSKSNAQNDAIIKACREALVELVSLREREAILKKTVEELQRVGSLKDERLALLERSIIEYEKAIAAREKAEVAVTELRKNFEAQIKLCESQLASEKRKTFFWKIAAGFALVVGAVLGVMANRQ